jgi:site-specific DNA recombinase
MVVTQVGVWIRVSTMAQDEENQVPEIERFCRDHGYEIVKRYELNDRSAYKGEQEARQRDALTDTRTGTIKALVVWASDRIERRGAEATLRIFRLFREAGGRVESVQEPQLNGADPDLMLAITGWKDKQESARKSERVRIAFDRIKGNGAVYGGVPYGFVITGDKYSKQMVPDSIEAAIVREAAKRYLGGESLRTICRDFDGRGIPSPKGKPHWQAHTLSRVLRNPAIAGRKADGSGMTVVRCKPLISLRQFERIDKLMASRAHRKGVPSSKDTAMLTSVIKCDKCGHNVYGLSPNGRRYEYYYCRNGCKNMIRMDYADECVSDWITSSKSYEIRERRLIEGHNYDDEIDHIRQDIRELDPEADDYDERREALRAELRRLRELPSVPDRVELVDTGRMVSDEWPGWTKAERRAFLMHDEFTVILRGNEFPKNWRIQVKPGEPYRARTFGSVKSN